MQLFWCQGFYKKGTVLSDSLQHWMQYPEKAAMRPKSGIVKNSINIVWHPFFTVLKSNLCLWSEWNKATPVTLGFAPFASVFTPWKYKKVKGDRDWTFSWYLGGRKRKWFLGSINSFLVWMRPATWKNFAFQAGMNVCFNHTLSSISGQWSV